MDTPRIPLPENRWEARWTAAEGTFDPSYERTTEALRRWVDGMEQALVSRASRQTSRQANFSSTRR